MRNMWRLPGAEQGGESERSGVASIPAPPAPPQPPPHRPGPGPCPTAPWRGWVVAWGRRVLPVPTAGAGWGAQVVPAVGGGWAGVREERWHDAGSVPRLVTRHVAPPGAAAGPRAGARRRPVWGKSRLDGQGGRAQRLWHPWARAGGCHAPLWGAHGHPAGFADTSPALRAASTQGGTPAQRWGDGAPCPTPPRSSPSSRAQRVRQGPAPSGCSGKPPACFLPACLPSNSSPGTLAASSEPRPVFLAHIFLLHIALGVTLHRGGNTAAFAGEVPASPPCQRCAQRLAGRWGAGQGGGMRMD